MEIRTLKLLIWIKLVNQIFVGEKEKLSCICNLPNKKNECWLNNGKTYQNMVKSKVFLS